MNKYPGLSNADNFIMEILWRDGACGSAEILREIETERDWSRQTVRTYLARLIEKGLVGTREVNRRTLEYYPLVSKATYAADRSGGILRRYYDSLPHMVAGLLQNEKLSDADLDALENLIRQARQKGE
ncbi:MAG: BlaI/MecI/CopY family transcriptional regulator [Clostridiales bacterium]|nr:BlaI/MecI/CopY family transcriptional regulator [Clostridiales bacterium]